MAACMARHCARAILTCSPDLLDGRHEGTSIKGPGRASARMGLSGVLHAIQLPPCEVEACGAFHRTPKPCWCYASLGIHRVVENDVPSMGTTTDHLRPWAFIDM